LIFLPLNRSSRQTNNPWLDILIPQRHNFAAALVGFGAAAGMLWQLHQMARAGLWSDPYGGARMRLQPSVLPGYASSYGRAMRAR